jgi:dihydrofolate reductase
MTINIIAAINNTNSIGLDGKLLVKLEKDLHRFRDLTMGHTVVLGRRSFEEIGKALPGRKNIVLSRKNYEPPKDVTVIASLETVLEQFKHTDDILWVCGGEEVFRQAFPYVDRVYLTKIDDATVGDTFFPIEYFGKNFIEIHKEVHEENGIEFMFLDYMRKGDVDGTFS